MKLKTTFVLGAADPEMNAIEEMAKKAGCAVVYAMAAGKRVFPANAYKADAVEGEINGEVGEVVFVECRVRGVSSAVVIDHHNPGDPGYGLSPEQYWEASSVGQAAKLLGVEKTSALAMVAAADHCLGHAYQGKCPGVDPEALMEWRAQSRAAFQKRTVGEVLSDVEMARKALRLAPKVTYAGVDVADFGDSTVAELPEAAAREGVPFQATTQTPDGRTKVGLMSAPAAVVRAWMDAQKGTLKEIYGDPERGFAGGFN